MQAVTSLFVEIRAVLDCPAVHALCLDVWELAQRDGEAAGLVHARNLLSGVRAWVAERDRLARMRGAGVAGAVLGAAPLPSGRNWWALLEGGDVVPGDDRRAGAAVYWCESSAGWWRVQGGTDGKA